MKNEMVSTFCLLIVLIYWKMKQNGSC